jgi:hypothetical protein
VGFTNRWEVQRASGESIFSIDRVSNSCRDSAFYSLQRRLASQFYTVGHVDTNTVAAKHAFGHWALNHGNSLRYIGAFFEDYHVQYADWMRDYTIPRAIDSLRRKYPTVEFTLVSENVPSGWNQSILRHGIQVAGDTAVIPAFYWTGYIQRCANIDHRGTGGDWRDVNKLLERVGARDHIEAWDRLRTGNEPSPLDMLAVCAGPVVTFDKQKTGRLTSYKAGVSASALSGMYADLFSIVDL